ncbi:MAG: phosphoribosylamine--glycine ligase [Bacteroidetes bacterium]|nr:phosphoribosylamine--glycine ligase [Bacteroidota bacterium]
MNILLVGSGGREHALAWKISQSPLTRRLFVAPGNAGTSKLAENLSVKADDFQGLATICKDKQIDLLVVGPEAPLVNGLRDFLEKDNDLRNLLIVGPGMKGAQLEGSKDFSKQFMQRHKIPTAGAKTFSSDQVKEGIRFLITQRMPVVLKADGLAAGKGVVICQSLEESEETLRSMLAGKFGEASSRVLIEEFLTGIELSVFVLTDGSDYVLLPEAKDYKRVGEGDTGLNTGGMGAVSPVNFATAAFMSKVEERIIKPTIKGLKEEKIDYRGFIFFGLINVNGDPYVIEYNARMGDPETEAVMTRIESDLVEVLAACASGHLKGKVLATTKEHAITVVMVAAGYPGDYQKGHPISGLDAQHDAIAFHAGTKLQDSQIVTDGGRVLAITGRGKDIDGARQMAYKAVSGISWTGSYFRRDIGLDLQRLTKR